jgi:hypothetical protein
MFLHNLLNVLVQIANKMGLKKKLYFREEDEMGGACNTNGGE